MCAALPAADTDFVFAASQVWQYAALHADHPAVFEALRAMVAAGRFVPVGGAWVEPDANMPSGESLVRQFLFGTSWASAHLGKEVAAAAADAARALGRPVPRRIPHGDGVFFLPDTFGYCPQLPQIIRGCGMRYFFTQKLSWSLVNKPEHNTFWWRALDGTEVLTHFAPADDYNCQATVESVVKSAAQNKDRGRVSHGIMLYGNGDGGGGPNLPMFEQLRRLGARPHVCRADSSTAPAVEPSGPVCETLPGMPAVLHASPRQFFDALASDASRWDVVTWSGELFLELHNGEQQDALSRARLRQSWVASRVLVCMLTGALSLCCRHSDIPGRHQARKPRVRAAAARRRVLRDGGCVHAGQRVCVPC